MALLLPGEPYRCPAGHAVPKNAWALGKATPRLTAYRCHARNGPALTGTGAHVCNATIFALVLSDGVRLVVAVSSAELHQMEAKRMTLSQIRDFLGLVWSADA